ncbi:MAG: PadR family transcriptional regulator [Rhodoglobus sp.]
MSVKLSVLAILDQGPCYGNQIRAEFERRTGATWPLNVGQIYTTLDRLERDGLATRQPGNEAGHVLYEITETGRAAAREWLATPVDQSVVPRDELVVKLALAMTLPGADPATLIRAQREAIAGAHSEDSAAPDGSPAGLIQHSAALHACAQLEWLDYCEALLGRREVYGLSAEPPRRGRPARAS